MATISSSPLLSPHLLPPPPASTLNPIILIIILLLLIAVLFSLPLLRHLRRRTPAALISPSLANRRSGSLLPPVFSFSSSAGYCAVCLSEIGRRDLLRRLPVCRHGFHAACIDTWLRFNQTCPLCRSPVHGGGGAHFRPETGSGG